MRTGFQFRVLYKCVIRTKNTFREKSYTTLSKILQVLKFENKG